MIKGNNIIIADIYSFHKRNILKYLIYDYLPEVRGQLQFSIAAVKRYFVHGARGEYTSCHIAMAVGSSLRENYLLRTAIFCAVHT